MALKTELVQKLSQNLLMTPQLQQAIKLLQLGRLEYREAIEREVLENPLFELANDPDEGHSDHRATVVIETQLAPESLSQIGEDFDQEDQLRSSAAEAPAASDSGSTNAGDSGEGTPEWDGYLDLFSDYGGAAAPKGNFDEDATPRIDGIPGRSQSLEEYLLEQLRTLDFSDEEKNILLHFIGNLDRNGYLSITYDEIAQAAGCSSEKVESVALLLRDFDPPGVGARSWVECLTIQLENLDKGDSLAARIITKHAKKLEGRRYDQIAKAEKVTVEDVKEALKLIQQLEPRPGRSFGNEPARYAEPDVYVRRVGGDYVIMLNEEGLPKLRLNPHYVKLLEAPERLSSEQKNYINERFKSASWLMRSMDQRQRTIYKVTESIVKFQREFIDYGITRLKPLVLKDVARDIQMHESTVSRITSNKFMHTPQGIFELKFFFSTGLKTTKGDISSSTIKNKIQALVGAESEEEPISDQQIVETLRAEGVNIARRTVAKYREALGIPASHKRKAYC